MHTVVHTGVEVQYSVDLGETWSLVQSVVHAGVEVQYSVDLGETWSLVQSECTMGTNIACESYTAASILSSDVFYDWTRVAIKLPYYTRSQSVSQSDTS